MIKYTNDSTKLNSLLKKIVKNNKIIVEKYKNGEKGYIGFFYNKVIEESTISYFDKKSKYELINNIKKYLYNL